MGADTVYAILYMEINLIAVILVAIIGFKTRGLSKMVAQRNFAMSIGAETVFFLSDTLYVMGLYGLFPCNTFTILFFKTLYFLSTTLMCYFWFIYFEHMQESTFVESRRNVRLSSFAVWIMALLLLVNLFTGILFYVDENGEYQRGKLFIVLYLIPYAYVFVACFRAFLGIFQKEKLDRRRQLILLSLFPVAPAAAGILQFFFPEIPVACATLSIATLLLYLEWMDRVISVDPLTKLNNRKQLAYRWEVWRNDPEEGQQLYLLIVDANKFKSINDTYGHVEGDAALVRIADALRLACHLLKGKSSISRYGGDEFVVLAWVDRGREEEEIDFLIREIRKNLERLNREAESPYPLSVCIGKSRVGDRKDLKEVIEEADALLYNEKRR